MELQPEILIANRYKLIRQLGRGGFSEVWLAEDTTVGLQLAVKIFAPNGGLDQDAQKVFSEEYKSVFSLNHQNLLIPQHLDFYQDMPFLILPYCEKGSLVKKVGSITEKEAWKIIYDVAAGLDYLHKHDIVHQDIKPDNILVTADEHYMITDFGISVRLQSTLRKSVNKAAEAGTVSYMAPERFSAHPKPIFASDVWSLGAMMYELIEGDVPYGNMGGVLQKSGAEIPEIEANVSDELKNIIRQMMSLEPWDRPTADKLVEIARNAIEGKTVPTGVTTEGRQTDIKKDRTIPEQPKSGQQSKSKNKRVTRGLAILSILSGVLLAILFTSRPKTNEDHIDQSYYDTSSVYTDTINTSVEFRVEQISVRTYLGPFSVSATKKVKFAKGNLQFNAAQGTHRCADGTTKQGTWRFAPNQWDYIGYGNENISPTYDGWIDLFGWGTSGWNSGAVAYQPWSTSTSYSDYYPGGNSSNNLTGAYANADWGVYNQIGSDVPGTWRTLTKGEWEYLCNSRPNANNLKGQATVNGVNGFVLLPDDFWSNSGSLAFTSGTNLGWDVNRFSVSQWREFEQLGAVFLPSGGYRSGSFVGSVGLYGLFWSVSQSSSDYAWSLYFNDGNSLMGYSTRYYGQSVRLSQDL